MKTATPFEGSTSDYPSDPQASSITARAVPGADYHHLMTRVLLAEDDASISEPLARALRREGYEVEVREDGPTALDAGLQGAVDLVVLDLGLPGMDGLEVARRLRAEGHTVPILVLTARDAVSDRVAGLDAGADDYLPKPFALEELLARLRALLRRSPPEGNGIAGSAGIRFEFADLVLDEGTREVTRGERRISLTRTEFSLLELLLRHPRQVLTRGRILEDVWGYDFPTSGNALEDGYEKVKIYNKWKELMK